MFVMNLMIVHDPFIINMIEFGNMNTNDHKILIALEYMNMGSLNKNLLILNGKGIWYMME